MSDQITEQDFDTRLDEFVADCQAMIDKHFKEDFPTQSKKIAIRPGGKKYIAIDVMRDDKAESIWAFIAVGDGHSKGMGHYKKGDIFKSASYKTPAKHARGNIFDDAKGMEHVTSYGPAYL